MEKNIELTTEQKKELEDLFQYREKAEFTDEEKETLKTMFDTPEKLSLLRKGLNLFTSEERGLKFHSTQSLVQANITDLQGYAIETAVNNLAEEKVRSALFSLYRMILSSKVEEKKKEFEKKNLEDFEEKKQKEKYEELEEQAKQHLGENL